MATLAQTDYPHITINPEVCSGRPCIAGTRVRVMDVVAIHGQGVSPEELQNYFATRPLTLAEIYAALAYYNDHKEEVDEAFASDARLTEQGMADEAEFLKRRSGP